MASGAGRHPTTLRSRPDYQDPAHPRPERLDLGRDLSLPRPEAWSWSSPRLFGMLCFFWSGMLGRGAEFPVVGVEVVVAGVLSFRQLNGLWQVGSTGDERVFLSMY